MATLDDSSGGDSRQKDTGRQQEGCEGPGGAAERARRVPRGSVVLED